MSNSAIKSLVWKPCAVGDLPTINASSILLCAVALTRHGQSVLSDSQRAQAIDLLSDIQWDRFERRPLKAKETYLTGRYYLLTLLGQLSGQAPENITLSYNRLNKPFLEPNPQGIEFNFTDTTLSVCPSEPCAADSIGLFAFNLNSSIGVDLEAQDRRANVQKIARKRFSPIELTYVNEGEPSRIGERFLHVWTRKEAFGKACGVGINFKMNALNLLEPLSASYQFNHDNQPWCLHQVQGPKQEIACVVYSGATFKTIEAVNLQLEL